MVGLPLVIGSKSIASRYVSPAQPIEVFDSDDVGNDGPSILVPSALLPNTSIPAASTDSPDGIATIVTARSSDQELLAVITIYYYHMLRQAPHSTEEQEVAYSVAELHIQKRSYLFSCLWNWRANVLGYTTCHVPNHPNEIIQNVTSYFGIDQAQRRKFVCLMSAFNSTHHTVMIQKESYNMAIISPPYEASYQTRPTVRESTILLLSANSVSYPIVTTASNRKNYEIDWMESRVPNSYLSTYDAPHLATIGKRFGRSIATASSRGFCVLDRSNDVWTTIVNPVP